VNPLLGAQLVGDVGEVAADQREGDDVAVLRGELQAHLKVVLENLAVEAEQGEVRGLHNHLVQVVNHLGVETKREKKLLRHTVPGTVRITVGIDKTDQVKSLNIF